MASTVGDNTSESRSKLQKNTEDFVRTYMRVLGAKGNVADLAAELGVSRVTITHRVWLLKNRGVKLPSYNDRTMPKWYDIDRLNQIVEEETNRSLNGE